MTAKNLRAFAALSCLLSPVSRLPAFAAPLSAKSAITAVTVYTDRAIVTRTAALDLAAAGAAEVTFEKLPANLVDQSLQVSGRGAAQVTILDVAARTTFVDATPNERVKALEDELRDLGKQKRVLDDRANLLAMQEKSLGRLEGAATAPPVKDSAPRMSIEESAKLLQFLEENLSKLATARQTLTAQQEELAAKIDAAQRQLNQLRGSGGRSFKTVTVRLDAATAGQLDLTLSYAVPGASWMPSYDARVNSNEKTIALAYHGIVRQNTGEDWKDVALTLSTARPSLGGAAPEQRPWAVDVFDRAVRDQKLMNDARTRETAVKVLLEAQQRQRAEMAAGRAVTLNMPMATQAASAAAPEPLEAMAAQAEFEASATSASFKITSPASVASDNSPQKVPITTAPLAATPEYLTTPKLQPAAFLTAKVVNSSDFPLLAGAMNVFLDGTFVATSHLRTVMSGEKFDLALGADEGIAVKHKRVQRFTEDTGLTNSGKRITYEYLLTLQNNKKTAARIIVNDQLPVSRNEKIVVKQLAPEAKEIKPTAEGALKWTLDLKPGEKRELTLKFSIDHPNDVQVTGLEP
ncbi:MAG: mucoidy inhibitor MuiA family protein [Verrucomicrobia bacterium]|nr:mucoidy inhibitor MuiA family protein [Verrucomicrobiota bacterium]